MPKTVSGRTTLAPASETARGNVNLLRAAINRNRRFDFYEHALARERAHAQIRRGDLLISSSNKSRPGKQGKEDEEKSETRYHPFGSSWFRSQCARRGKRKETEWWERDGRGEEGSMPIKRNKKKRKRSKKRDHRTSFVVDQRARWESHV